MSDFYTELLVKKEVTMKDKVIKVLLIALTAIAAVGGLFLESPPSSGGDRPWHSLLFHFAEA